MIFQNVYPNATEAWLTLVDRALGGSAIAPRGLESREVINSSAAFDLNEPVLACAARKPSYRLMAGEALWILSGSNRLADVTPYNKRMVEFSDDGETLWGAYGPRYVEQKLHVVNALARDPSTRQAVLTPWRPNPPATKDVPCTISLNFLYRNSELHLVANMRSSDVWLGVPYDMFAFAMIAVDVLCAVRALNPGAFAEARLGAMVFNAASSHVYATNYDQALAASRAGADAVGRSDLAERIARRDPAEAIFGAVAEARDRGVRPFGQKA